MTNRTLAKRLERLETRIMPADQEIIHRIVFVSAEDMSVTKVLEVKNWSLLRGYPRRGCAASRVGV